MKSIIILLISAVFVFSCEEIVDVDVPKSKQRLVIDASINWEKGSDGKKQEIKLTLSTPFFDEKTVPANGAIIEVKNSKGDIYVFNEFKKSGIYICDDFNIVADEQYTLVVNYENEIYEAKETMKSVVPIEFVEQKDDGGFEGKTIELKAFYTDPKTIKNYYQFEFYKNKAFSLPIINVYDDAYSNGNTIFAFYTEETLKIGDTIDIKNYGISKQYYEFMSLLLQQSSENSGGPFQTQPATVRGNCINITNPENFPFGYFKLSEVANFNYIIKDNTK